MRYANQITAGHEIYNCWKNATGNYPPVLFVAPPQAGKTESVFEGIERIILDNQQINKKTVIFWIGPSDNAIKDQTTKRITDDSPLIAGSMFNIEHVLDPNTLTGTRLSDGVAVYHMPDLLHKEQDIENMFQYHRNMQHCIIVVMDEAHIGIANGQTIPKFFIEKLGFFPGFQDSKDNIFTIIVTATPASFIFYGGERKKVGNGDAFHYVYLNTTNDYCSFETLMETGRLKNATQINSQDDYDSFENSVLSPYFFSDKIDNGYFIVRAKSEKCDLVIGLKNSIAVNANCEIRYYRSDFKNNPNKNVYSIEELDKHLQENPDKKVIAVIFGGFLQGKTFSTLQYVRGWWDRISQNTNHTFIIQSAGRCCGYKGSKDPVFKKDYIFPVFIDLTMYPNICEFYDYCANGRWSDLEKDHLIDSAHTRASKNKPSKPQWIYLSTENDEQAVINKYNIAKDKTRRMYVSRESTHDVAKEIIEERIMTQRKDKGIDYLLIFVDGQHQNPIKVDFHNSWNELANHAKFKNEVGKVRVLVKRQVRNVQDKSLVKMHSYGCVKAVNASKSSTQTSQVQNVPVQQGTSP